MIHISMQVVTYNPVRKILKSLSYIGETNYGGDISIAIDDTYICRWLSTQTVRKYLKVIYHI